MAIFLFFLLVTRQGGGQPAPLAPPPPPSRYATALNCRCVEAFFVLNIDNYYLGRTPISLTFLRKHLNFSIHAGTINFNNVQNI